jgi:hypothetical protein
VPLREPEVRGVSPHTKCRPTAYFTYGGNDKNLMVTLMHETARQLQRFLGLNKDRGIFLRMRQGAVCRYVVCDLASSYFQEYVRRWREMKDICRFPAFMHRP